MTETEYGIRSRDWAEELYGSIPEHELLSAFKLAVKLHTSAFPLSAYEILTAHQRIVESRLVDFSFCNECDADGLKTIVENGNVFTTRCKHQAALQAT